MYMTAEQARDQFPGAFIEHDAYIGQGAVIERGARIGQGRQLVTRTLTVGGLGTTRQFTAHDSEDGLVIVIGCFNNYKGGTVEEAREAISSKYPAGHPYFTALALAVAWHQQEETKR